MYSDIIDLPWLFPLISTPIINKPLPTSRMTLALDLCVIWVCPIPVLVTVPNLETHTGVKKAGTEVSLLTWNLSSATCSYVPLGPLFNLCHSFLPNKTEIVEIIQALIQYLAHRKHAINISCYYGGRGWRARSRVLYTQTYRYTCTHVYTHLHTHTQLCSLEKHSKLWYNFFFGKWKNAHF